MGKRTEAVRSASNGTKYRTYGRYRADAERTAAHRGRAGAAGYRGAPRGGRPYPRRQNYGDLTENAEYEAAKNAQAFIEGRILDLKRILANARTLVEDEVPTDAVGLGSMVTVRDLDYGDEWTLTLVSPFEADPDKDRISNHSPVGRALMGRRAGDAVTVKTPGGETHYEIAQIGK